jgi:hypothetical protein
LIWNKQLQIPFQRLFIAILLCSLESLDQGVIVGESLIAGSGTTRWLSPSGDFAFGFYELPNELFLLAIWYDKMPSFGMQMETTLLLRDQD